MNSVRRVADKIRADRYLSLLVSGSVINGAVAALGVAMFFLAFLLLARLLGAVQYGVFSIVYSWLSILAMAATLGADQLLLRLVAAYRVKGESGELHGLLHWSRRLVWSSGLAVGLLAAALVGWLGGESEAGMQASFWLGCLALPLLAEVQLHQQALRSLRHYALGMVPDRIIKPLLLMALFWALSRLSPPLESADAMLIFLGATALSLLLLRRWLRRLLPVGTLEAEPRSRNREWLRASLPLLVVSGMHMVLSNTDIVMLGIFADARQAGIYSAASRIASMVAFGLLMVNTIAAPLFSELFAAGEMERLQRLVSHSALGITAIVAAILLPVLLFGEEVLALFGAEFAAGYAALLILGIGQLLNALCGPVGYLLAMTGHQDVAARVLTLSALLNVAGNAVMIPAYGMLGAAVTTAVTTVLWNLVMVVEVRRRLEIRPTVFALRAKRAGDLR